jgi:outer membrane protein insertion porin family
VGINSILRESQLQVQPAALASLTSEFPYFKAPTTIQPVSGTNYRPRSSTGLEIQVIMPVVNAPFRVFYGYNWLRMDTAIYPPQQLPPRSLFPNEATYDQVLPLFEGLHLSERRSRLGFTVARTF